MVTDHVLLLGLLGEAKATLPLTSAHLQCWALLLTAYQYQLIHKPGLAIANADGLSWLLMGRAPEDIPVPQVALALARVEEAPQAMKQITQWTNWDPVLSQVSFCTEWMAWVDGILRHTCLFSRALGTKLPKWSSSPGVMTHNTSPGKKVNTGGRAQSSPWDDPNETVARSYIWDQP